MTHTDIASLLNQHDALDDPEIRRGMRRVIRVELSATGRNVDLDEPLARWSVATGPDRNARLAICAAFAAQGPTREAALDALFDALDGAWLLAWVADEAGTTDLERFCATVVSAPEDGVIAAMRRLCRDTLVAFSRGDRARAADLIEAIPERAREHVDFDGLIRRWPRAHEAALVDAVGRACVVAARYAPSAVVDLVERTLQAMSRASLPSDDYERFVVSLGEAAAAMMEADPGAADDLVERCLAAMGSAGCPPSAFARIALRTPRPMADAAEVPAARDLTELSMDLVAGLARDAHRREIRHRASHHLVKTTTSDERLSDAERQLLEGVQFDAWDEYRILEAAARADQPEVFAAVARNARHHDAARALAACVEGASVFDRSQLSGRDFATVLRLGEVACAPVAARAGALVLTCADWLRRDTVGAALDLIRRHHGGRWFDAWASDVRVASARPRRLLDLLGRIHDRVAEGVDGGLLGAVDADAFDGWARSIGVDGVTLLRTLRAPELAMMSPTCIGEVLARSDDPSWRATRDVTRTLCAGLSDHTLSDHALRVAEVVFAAAAHRPNGVRHLVDVALEEGGPLESLSFAFAISSESADADLLARLAARARQLWRNESYVEQIVDRVCDDPALDGDTDLLRDVLSLATDRDDRDRVIERLAQASEERGHLLIAPDDLAPADLTAGLTRRLMTVARREQNLHAWATLARLGGEDDEPDVMAELLDAPDDLRPSATALLDRFDAVLAHVVDQHPPDRRARHLQHLLAVASQPDTGRGPALAKTLHALGTEPAVRGIGELEVLGLVLDDDVGGAALETLAVIGTIACVPRLRRIARNPFRGRETRGAAKRAIDAILERHDPIEGALAIVDGPSGALSTTSE